MQPADRRLVDQPGRHDQASDMTTGSSRSAVSDANRASASSVTGPEDSNRSRSSARRRYTVRDSPSRLALASIATRTSSGTSRIRMSVTLPSSSISHDIIHTEADNSTMSLQTSMTPGTPTRSGLPVLVNNLTSQG